MRVMAAQTRGADSGPGQVAMGREVESRPVRKVEAPFGAGRAGCVAIRYLTGEPLSLSPLATTLCGLKHTPLAANGRLIQRRRALSVGNFESSQWIFETAPWNERPYCETLPGACPTQEMALLHLKGFTWALTVLASPLSGIL